ncbi:phosphomannomutase [Flavimaricola marinus]|uniref:Phosphoglucosamine mutase n=1 Tax=Flavimaricola marinus TaxID=1819565 RepID=A0A238LHX7_9RHOB|nr:phosphomannomutase [Flavimaricola marinus]SMY09228.1 Phosphoglucosamine mutase [Flavimaricola marinus]
MPPKFGTSGLRGLVTELTETLVADHVAAFISACPTGTGLFIGQDLRSSSPMLADVVARTGQAAGLAVTDCGAVPTPALAMASMQAGAAAVMITGSHIPDDRNGLKFYTPEGEITKEHEAAILATLGTSSGAATAGPAPASNTGANAAYIARYVTAFGPEALAGLTIGVYSHSAVGRDVLIEAFQALGAKTLELGRADRFIPVDTEAVDAETRAQLAAWAAEHPLDAIASTDGDGDRPLMTDETGRVIVGDVLGQITGAMLGAEVAVTPVSSNTGAEAGGAFGRVIRTRIGSPFVIAGMEQAGGKVVGYEANGGFLLGFEAQGPAGPLPPLMTRDALLPLIAPLVQARGAGGLAALVAAQPPRFTAADRLQEVPTERSLALVASLSSSAEERARFLASFEGSEARIDQTDGLRITMTDGRIVHLRPSGNAPELRFYGEADSAAAAEALLAEGLAILRAAVDG